MRNGCTAQSDTGTQAVVAKRQRVAVVPDLVLTLITGGIRLILLGFRLLDWPTDRAVLSVDASGELRGEFSS